MERNYHQCLKFTFKCLYKIPKDIWTKLQTTVKKISFFSPNFDHGPVSALKTMWDEQTVAFINNRKQGKLELYLKRHHLRHLLSSKKYGFLLVNILLSQCENVKKKLRIWPHICSWYSAGCGNSFKLHINLIVRQRTLPSHLFPGQRCLISQWCCQ